MKTKKKLQQIAEKDKQSLINEKDIALFDSYGVSFGEAPPPAEAKNFNLKAFIISLSCFAVAAVAVFLIVFYSLQSRGNGFKYSDTNIKSVDSDLAELNGDLKNFKILMDENGYNLNVKKFYDSVSSDTLYYELSAEAVDMPIDYYFRIIVNEHFIYNDFKFNSDVVTEATLSNYPIRYSTDIKPSEIDESVNKVNCAAEWKIGKQTVYVMNYKELSLGEGMFLENLQSVIKVN